MDIAPPPHSSEVICYKRDVCVAELTIYIDWYICICIFPLVLESKPREFGAFTCFINPQEGAWGTVVPERDVFLIQFISAVYGGIYKMGLY